MKIKKGDKVLVISGKDRGKISDVIRALPREHKIVASGVNIKKKHQRPKSTKEKGQRLELPAPFSVSDVKLICPKCNQATRVGYRIFTHQNFSEKNLGGQAKTKRRFCKKCQSEI